MPEWKEKLFEVKGATQVSFVSSPAKWLNELQERYYLGPDTLRIMELGDGRLYILVRVEGDKSLESSMDARKNSYLAGPPDWFADLETGREEAE